MTGIGTKLKSWFKKRKVTYTNMVVASDLKMADKVIRNHCTHHADTKLHVELAINEYLYVDPYRDKRIMDLCTYGGTVIIITSKEERRRVLKAVRLGSTPETRLATPTFKESGDITGFSYILYRLI